MDFEFAKRGAAVRIPQWRFWRAAVSPFLTIWNNGAICSLRRHTWAERPIGGRGSSEYRRAPRPTRHPNGRMLESKRAPSRAVLTSIRAFPDPLPHAPAPIISISWRYTLHGLLRAVCYCGGWRSSFPSAMRRRGDLSPSPFGVSMSSGPFFRNGQMPSRRLLAIRRLEWPPP